VKTRSDTGVVLVSVAICIALLLGTLGWFMVGFGMMTDCTNNYSCTMTGCPPCATTEHWLNAGGIAQFVLAGTGVVVLVLSLRVKQRPNLAVSGAVLLVMSVLTMVSTTWRAQESYCQPGTPGYATSYCSVGD
jgi:hypothetical protein